MEILLIVLAILLIFGARRLPELGKAVGDSIRSFKQSVSGDGGEKKE